MLAGFKKLVEQMKSGGLDQDDSDDKTFKYELVSSGGVKRKIGEGEEQHTTCAGFVLRARRGSEASFQLCQG